MKILSKIKGGFKNILTKIVDYDSYIYLSMLFLVIGTLLWANLEIKHNAGMLNLQKEKAILLMNLEDSEILSKSKGQVLQIQSNLMLKQRDELRKADQLIEMQHRALEQLMQRLKSLNVWPPSEPKLDINRII
tara:strand:+ start:1789 stop:2187 length:399 start_codon:yes stop_codon:yes gene_type:complete